MIDIRSVMYERIELIIVKGRINSETAPKLNQTIRSLLDQGRYYILLDLSEVSFMNSAGLRILVATLKATRPRGGDLRLLNPSERTLETLRFAGLLAVFKVFNSLNVAIDEFNKLVNPSDSKS